MNFTYFNSGLFKTISVSMILVALSATRKQYPDKALKNSGCSLELAVTEVALITSRIIKNETTVSFNTTRRSLDNFDSVSW